jgi:hypothetical protein
VRVTGRFNRDRDREQAYPPLRQSSRRIGKSSTVQALSTLFGQAGVGAIVADLRGGGIAPSGK